MLLRSTIISVIPFLRVSSPFDSLDWGLTPVRVTASYSNENEGLVVVLTDLSVTKIPTVDQEQLMALFWNRMEHVFIA